MFTFDGEKFNEGNKKVRESITDVDTLDNLATEVSSMSSDLDGIDISSVTADINDVKDKLTKLESNIQETEYVLYKYSDSFGSSSEGFGEGFDDEDDLEDGFCDFGFDDDVYPLSPFSTDKDGEYGSTQGSAYYLFQEYLNYKSFQKKQKNNTKGITGGAPSMGFMPGLTDEEQGQVDSIIDLFNEKGITDESVMLEVLDWERKQGCGHAVLANWTLERYGDKPEEFEEKFGYPLYTESYNGKTYNYATLTTDIYLKSNDKFLSDNITENGFVLNNDDSSIHPDEMGEKYSAFLGEHVDTVVVNRDASIETYQKYLGEGYTDSCIAGYRFDLKPHGTNEEEDWYISDKSTEDGHWMTITGVSDDGNFVVSSWGQEWELTTTDLYAKFPVNGIQAEDRDDECLIFVKNK